MPKIIADEVILAEIQAKSTNGIAPAAANVSGLYSVAQRRFGSWEKACTIAGVMTRSPIHRKEHRRKRGSSGNLKLLAQTLHIASKAGRPDAFFECAGYVRGDI